MGILWWQHWCQWHHISQNITLHLILIILNKQIQLCYWQCHQYHMMQMQAPNASHYQKGHVAPHFDYLDITNVVVPLRMPLASHDADAGTKSITGSKMSYYIFWASWHNKWNGVFVDMFGIMTLTSSMASHDLKGMLHNVAFFLT